MADRETFYGAVENAGSAYATFGLAWRHSRVLPMRETEDVSDKKARIKYFEANVCAANLNFCRVSGSSARANFSDFDDVLPLCESPIEKHILPWLVMNDYWPIAPRALTLPHRRGISEYFPVVVCPQVEVFKYRLDFGIFATFGGQKKLFAFECDGEAFHEASRDHVRDMHLLRRGVQTLRASGAEIYNDPASCSRRVSDAIVNWSRSLKVEPAV